MKAYAAQTHRAGQTYRNSAKILVCRLEKGVVSSMNTRVNEQNQFSADDVQAEIASEFALLGDWTERYAYVIDLGRGLQDFPAQYRTDEYRFHGCQATVWFRSELGDDGYLYFDGTSDSTIVSGLMALVFRLYSGRKPEDIVNIEPHFIDEIGLKAHLSTQRATGLLGMLQEIKGQAQALLA